MQYGRSYVANSSEQEVLFKSGSQFVPVWAMEALLRDHSAAFLFLPASKMGTVPHHADKDSMKFAPKDITRYNKTWARLWLQQAPLLLPPAGLPHTGTRKELLPYPLLETGRRWVESWSPPVTCLLEQLDQNGAGSSWLLIPAHC